MAALRCTCPDMRDDVRSFNLNHLNRKGHGSIPLAPRSIRVMGRTLAGRLAASKADSRCSIRMAISFVQHPFRIIGHRAQVVVAPTRHAMQQHGQGIIRPPGGGPDC